MLKREKYLSKIEPFFESELIKVIAGMRRSGKSILLNQIRERVVENGVTEKQIQFINFESLKYKSLYNADTLYEYLSDKLLVNAKNYIFFDEIQIVENFESVLNSLRVDFDVSIFVTGSNADLLSGELASLLSGRYIKFDIFPFTYQEYVKFLKLDPENDAVFKDFLIYGGLPQTFNFQNKQEKEALLIDILDSIVYKDILMNLSAKNIETIKRFISYVVQSTGLDFNARSIVNHLKSERISTTPDTIYSYIDAILNSLIVRKCPRYDIKGKKILKRNEKYYVADLGLRNHTINLEKIDYGACYETIVYNQLVSDGYEVTIGKINDFEIDFIATKPGEKMYVQVTYQLASEEIIEREFRGLEAINDNYDKFVISGDILDFSRNGIKHINIIEFLMK
ncbi:MAG: ATP-binding protein [Candidatus Izimaplasma sp.]|nr:ATP-binding protein [Candidatus Izimaplasma bacterium]